MTERWRPVTGYEGIYEISNQGRIKRLADTRTCTADEYYLKPTSNNTGYLVVSLCRDGTVCMASVHRLVLAAFRGPCPPGMNCNHLNGIRTDNRIENLEWTTYRANVRHYRNVLKRGNTILSEDDVKFIRSPTGTLSQNVLAKMFGMSRSGIQSVVTRRTWRHISDEEDG